LSVLHEPPLFPPLLATLFIWQTLVYATSNCLHHHAQ
jgi:hypothetical protein